MWSKLNENFYQSRTSSYENLVKNNLRSSQNLAGWLQEFAPSENFNLEFENQNQIKNLKSISFWNIEANSINYNDSLEYALKHRETTPVNQLHQGWSEAEILMLMNKAISDGSRGKDYQGVHIPLRNYPSGGAQFPIKLYMVSNTNAGFFKKNKSYEIHSDLGLISRVEDVDFKFEEVFAISHFNKKLYKQTSDVPFVVVMVMNLKHSFNKYSVYSQHLAMIEAGHIGQNLQLVSTALGNSSMPNGGILSDITKEAIGLKNSIDDTVVYGVVFG
ncbi:hypothetical protein B4V05_10050 (plasmid) [Latilactobacillus sakei]|nr:hypothetical protein B4V05_10050 [Latilactobacillus sakei]KGB13862.1 hypothetical protein KY41_10895 [Latilactobacillus sakei]UTB73230.1 hypothetical protein A4W72_10740 [Latilactobacillus curvatus]